MNILNAKIGFGTYKLTKANEVYDVLKQVCLLEYDFIDTAKHYENEVAIGFALKKIYSNNLNYKKPFLQSKIWPSDFKNGIKKEILDCLRRLQISKIDVFLLHRPHVDMTLNVKAWKELILCQQEKLVDYIGVCNFDRDQIQTLYHETKVFPTINQIEASVTYMRYDRIKYNKKNNISIQGWRPFGNYNYTFKSNFLQSMALKNNCSVAQIMLAFVMNQGIIPICRSNIKSEISDNILAKNIYLTPQDLFLIESHMNTYIPSTHNGCDSFANLSLDDDWFKTN